MGDRWIIIMLMQPMMMRGRLTLSELIRLKSMEVFAQMTDASCMARTFQSFGERFKTRHPRNFGEPRKS